MTTLHYLWPVTRAPSRPDFPNLKKNLESEHRKSQFLYFDPIIPRKNMTLTLSGPYDVIQGAKVYLKKILEDHKIVYIK